MTTFGWPNSSIHPYNHPSIHSEEGKRKAGGLVIFVFFPFFLLLLSELIGTWAKRTHFFYFFFFSGCITERGHIQGPYKSRQEEQSHLSPAEWLVHLCTFLPFFFFFCFPLLSSHPFISSQPSKQLALRRFISSSLYLNEEFLARCDRLPRVVLTSSKQKGTRTNLDDNLNETNRMRKPKEKGNNWMSYVHIFIDRVPFR